MSVFVIAYYTLLLGASCLAAYFNKRSAFLLLFSLTLVSFVLGIIGGVSALRIVAILAGLLALSAMVSYAFREFLVAIASKNLAKELRTAPLTAAFGMFVIFTVAVAGIFAPLIAPHGEAEVITSAFAPADANMLLGADQLGRDIFSRLVYGARNTVALALAGTVMAFLLGALAGLMAATSGGWFDQFLARTSDVIMSIPSLIFALLMLSIFGGDLANDTTSFWLLSTFTGITGLLLVSAIAERSLMGWVIGLAILAGVAALFGGFMLTIFNPSEIILILVVAVIYSPRVFRLTRAVAGNVVVMDYIEAAKLRGERRWYLIRREILPNSTAPLIAEFGLEFCFVFLLIAGLSFLGLGIQPPTADWGSMVRENATLISFGDITPLIPAAAIALLTVAVNFVVDWMLYRSSGLKV
ncbi:Binding-protein-dependent transport systems inner membrane component [Roseovarius sp. EC-HK134]|jgi:peptide/nickel transport system permease protein|uniref:ABC transporter permease n=1 Tax=Roseovarius TaxID=74030 RepID=UPI0001556EA5|nr:MULTISPECIES: ABC transporter permease [Roseovarius]AWZ19938.1 Ribose ABC transport system, permease protein RbsC [Roseovarius sp. AK1035]EDM31456.1 binding-protein-dependent transport systems inner membrane component [Roseovarius sp. TM1035]MBW4972983.1 ABC transporter permease [Roseovarius mucosus]VVT11307.1 Binding-protein-dependent transport systems inner membrane component [Roseovarius sp. EC-HK134]VVT11451.1 Binding-protein-dependent transport systems inner membrane component [Roseova